MLKYLLASSILSANFAELGKEIKKVIKSGSDLIHFDIMDSHYVPNLSIGPLVIQSLRDYGIKAPIDVHLMVTNVDHIAVQFAAAGANFITFHPENSLHLDKSIELIKSYQCKVGLAFNPTTPLNILKYIIKKIDLILLMSVNPGFSGQKFIPYVLNKIKEAKKLIYKSKKKIYLEIDGGIKLNNISSIVKCGGNIFVIGSEIFNSVSYSDTIKKFRYKIQKVNYVQ